MPAIDARTDTGRAERLATLVPLMGSADEPSRAAGTPRRVRPATAVAAVTVVTLSLLLAACSSGGGARDALADPPQSVLPVPDYTAVCAPIGPDVSGPCLRITLQAIDAAREREGLGPMRLPSDFARLPVPEQVFVALDRERVDRGLAPFAGLTATLDANAHKGAAVNGLPPHLGPTYSSVDTEWIGGVANGLDADYQWMYDDGPGSGVPGCTATASSGCWGDRGIVLDHFRKGKLVMGAAYAPNGDTAPGDRGGSSLATTLASEVTRTGGPYVYSWSDTLTATRGGTLRPLRSIPANESDSGIANPPNNVAPAPDFTRLCAGNGLDNSPVCLESVLAAVNHARALEGVRPMVLPAGYAQLSIADQLFVAVNLERVDRGLPPFGGLTVALNANAQRGADDANDPPDPGHAYDLVDAEWAGGSSNGLDAVYGWMYDDGFDSGNLDCARRDASGCWGHRKGILDNFGSGANLVMGAAIDTTGDTHSGDDRGTSMAVTLAVADAPVRSYAYSWDQVLDAPPATTGGGSTRH